MVLDALKQLPEVARVSAASTVGPQVRPWKGPMRGIRMVEEDEEEDEEEEEEEEDEEEEELASR